ncbi:MAG TPA: hypothetical protein VJ144_02035, partial [Candidatus Polarisedimenticolia bacterium]|nr:hypothetical protein [Candidatus Polarisedimenticolia bacterium]
MTRRPARPHAGRSLLLAASLALGALVPRGAPLAGDEPRQTAAEPQAPQGPVERVEVRGVSEGAPLDPTAFATVIRAADFADRVTSVPELLREAVGVQVKSLGGQFATVSVRASSAEQVMV